MLILLLLIPLFTPMLFWRLTRTLSRVEWIFVNASILPLLVGVLAPAVIAAGDPELLKSRNGREMLTRASLWLSAVLCVVGLILLVRAIRQGRGARPSILLATVVASIPLLLLMVLGVLSLLAR